MKKLIALLLTALFVCSLAACGANTDNDKKETKEPTEALETTDVGNSEVIDGGWADAQSIAVTDEVKALFEKVNKEQMTGAQLEPIAVLETQVVAGTNYLVLAKMTATVPDAVTTYALVTLYADLDGNASVTDFQESTATAPAPYDPENPVSGGWGEPETYAVSDEAKQALDKASETLTGAVYEAKALLATQVVAGMNYQLFCKATPSAADGAAYYAIVTVYADLEGNAEITDTVIFGSGDENGEAANEEMAVDDGAEAAASSKAE